MVLTMEKIRDVNYYTFSMNKTGPESTKNVSQRLRYLQSALENVRGLNQAQVAKEAKISKSAWNNALTGDNRISVNDAIKLLRTFGIELEWTYLGQGISRLPHDLAKEIDKLLAKDLSRQ